MLGHPFNPRISFRSSKRVAAKQTSPDAIERALNFYRAMGEAPDPSASRNHGPSWRTGCRRRSGRRAFNLVNAGVASVADVDAAIAHGPGLRWSPLGPFLNLHLSGGKGGIGALFDEPLWQATEGMWRDLGSLSVDADLGSRVMAGVTDEIGARDLTEAGATARRGALVKLLKLKAASESLP